MPDTKHKKVWREMIHRCHNQDRKDYQYYGARGITVCDEWRESYARFLAWSINNGYVDGLTIERINNDNGYSPLNCKWISMSEQMRNRRVFKNSSSKLTGVAPHKKNGTWVCYINIDKKRHYLGSYKTKEEALNVRNKYIIENNLPFKIQEI